MTLDELEVMNDSEEEMRLNERREFNGLVNDAMMVGFGLWSGATAAGTAYLLHEGLTKGSHAYFVGAAFTGALYLGSSLLCYDSYKDRKEYAPEEECDTSFIE